jgi:hypothetical protein
VTAQLPCRGGGAAPPAGPTEAELLRQQVAQLEALNAHLITALALPPAAPAPQPPPPPPPPPPGLPFSPSAFAADAFAVCSLQPMTPQLCMLTAGGEGPGALYTTLPSSSVGTALPIAGGGGFLILQPSAGPAAAPRPPTAGPPAAAARPFGGAGLLAQQLAAANGATDLLHTAADLTHPPTCGAAHQTWMGADWAAFPSSAPATSATCAAHLLRGGAQLQRAATAAAPAGPLPSAPEPLLWPALLATPPGSVGAPSTPPAGLLGGYGSLGGQQVLVLRLGPTGLCHCWPGL